MATHSTATRRFGCDARNVALVRAFVAGSVRSWGWADDDADDAILVASEMAANAVVHARSAFEVRLYLDESGLRVEVADRVPQGPVPAEAPRTATNGRGLLIVAATAASWGVVPHPDGKVVWAQLPGRRDT